MNKMVLYKKYVNEKPQNIIFTLYKQNKQNKKHFLNVSSMSVETKEEEEKKTI